MATVIRCDACDAPLGREVSGATLTAGSMVAAAQGDPRFVPTEQRFEYVLCQSCAAWLDAAAGRLATGAEAPR
ncbi:MAG: hypothetical protein O2798_10475 [Chloroflexi bacterium]|nr:hypothetical protein [Chloroflexota bacterium]MDA1241248.1 hypothetical protein [Chloroflexota bacterium]